MEPEVKNYPKEERTQGTRYDAAVRVDAVARVSVGSKKT